MARGKPITLETRAFSTKNDAKAFFKEILNRYRPGQRVSDEDAADLNALLKRHSEHKDKLGVGIAYFEVMSADYGTQCFRIIRADGSGDDFSYLHCINAN